MSWLAKLYETYEAGIRLELPDEDRLMPVSHTVQNAHIHIVIDGDGNFKRADVLEKTKVTLPATEKSAGRTGKKPPPHPLSDKIRYVAKDYPEYGGRGVSFFKDYAELLGQWCDSEYSHRKARAVYKYIQKGHVVRDLVVAKILFVDANECLLAAWPDVLNDICQTPKIFKVMPTLEKKKRVVKDIPEIDQGDAFVCWSVELDGEPNSSTWKDETLQRSWIDCYATAAEHEEFCFVNGKTLPVSVNHPAKLRHTGDKAKLISSNDDSGFTFRGRFTDETGLQAACVSFEVTQKAHNALRWLIDRQGFRNGDQVFVSWAVSGKSTPEPLKGFWELVQEKPSWQEATVEVEAFQNLEVNQSVNLGGTFAIKLQKYMAGYRVRLDVNEQIVIMGIDSATSTHGRMGIIYYRELLASEFLDRLESWHKQFAWFQRHTIEVPDPAGTRKPARKTAWPISSPSPRVIVEAAYGDIIKTNEKLKKSTIERILPCIVDGRPFPRDIMLSAVRRASNRMSKRVADQFSNYKTEKAEWEKHLGVACALYKGYCQRSTYERRKYKMALEENRTTRDYLYGRLLAIAERIEEMALIIADEKPRATHASRLMQRFADRPYSTWLNIEKGIEPYQVRLKNNIPPLAEGYKRLMDDVCDAFDIEEFKSKAQLSGEYLLGYHSQRKWFREHKLEQGKWVRKSSAEDATTC